LNDLLGNGRTGRGKHVVPTVDGDSENPAGVFLSLYIFSGDVQKRFECGLREKNQLRLSIEITKNETY
jgi:hypothetical protein